MYIYLSLSISSYVLLSSKPIESQTHLIGFLVSNANNVPNKFVGIMSHKLALGKLFIRVVIIPITALATSHYYNETRWLSTIITLYC